MKKIILLLTSVILLSCSNSDDETANNQNYVFHPPTWLQGTWYSYYDDNNQSIEEVENSFKFLEDNILRYSGTTENFIVSTNYNEQFGAQINTEYTSFTVSEEITTNRYVIKFTQVTGGQTIVIKQYFFKINDTTFKYDSEETPSIYASVYHKI